MGKEFRDYIRRISEEFWVATWGETTGTWGKSSDNVENTGWNPRIERYFKALLMEKSGGDEGEHSGSNLIALENLQNEEREHP